MWNYRELIWRLTVTEFKNRYQNTFLGFFWSLLSPLLLSGVLYFVFRYLFQQEQNFAASLLVGIVAWRFFASGTGSALMAIVGKASLVTKVYIPRQILVLSVILASLISSFLEFLVLVPILFILLGGLPLTILLFPVIHFLYFLIVYGAGLFLSALFVYFRDLNQIWEVLINILFFCAPIIYPISIVPAYLMPYYVLNPITQILAMYRSVMIAGALPSLTGILYLIVCGAAAVIIGNIFFSRLQRRFAEAI
ncbi:MAG TPA: ABC transporter permease [Dehalococcoidia bacterium]|nr:ABC transporter permease [Dehalococcoidia bacterium]